MSPRTNSQNQEIREKSREKILNAALDVFAHEGYHASSISRVAKKAGVSKGLIYNYFESKEELLEESLNQALSKAAEMPEGLLELPAKELFKNMIDYFVLSLENYGEVWRLSTSLILQEEFEFVKKAGKQKYDAFESIFTKVFTELKYEDPKVEAHFLMAVFDGIAIHKATLRDEYSLENAKKELIKRYKLEE